MVGVVALGWVEDEVWGVVVVVAGDFGVEGVGGWVLVEVGGVA